MTNVAKTEEQTKAELESRPRKVDLESLSQDQVDVIAEEIGKRIASDINTLCERARKMLSIYGLDIKVHYVVHPVNENPFTKSIEAGTEVVENTEKKEKKKRPGRKKKTE